MSTRGSQKECQLRIFPSAVARTLGEFWLFESSSLELSATMSLLSHEYLQRHFQDNFLSKFCGQLVQGKHLFSNPLNQLVTEHQDRINDVRNGIQHGASTESRVEQGSPVFPLVSIHAYEIRATGYWLHESGGDSRLGEVVFVADLINGFRAKDCKQRRVYWPKVHKEELGIGMLLTEIPHGQGDGCVGGDSVKEFLEHE